MTKILNRDKNIDKLMENVTDWLKNCFKEVMGFLKISISVHMWLVAETTLADEEVLQTAGNREEFLKLRGRTRIPVISKRGGQHFK